jgi:hypothetical protein
VASKAQTAPFKSGNYFEAQAYGEYEGVYDEDRKSLCALHATNNLLGYRAFTLAQYRTYDSRLNNFSSHVFGTAFENHPVLRCFLATSTLDAEALGKVTDAFIRVGADFVGVLVHQPGHYVAYRREITGNFLLVDSMSERGLRANAEESPRAFKRTMQRVHHNGHHIAFVGNRNNTLPWTAWKEVIQRILKRKRKALALNSDCRDKRRRTCIDLTSACLEKEETHGKNTGSWFL